MGKNVYMYMYVPMVLVDTNEKIKTMRVRTAETSESRIRNNSCFCERNSDIEAKLSHSTVW